MTGSFSTAQVGQSGLRIPLIGFGTAPLATAPAWGGGEPITEAQALETLHYAFTQGIRFFDTAPAYVRGLAETRTGKLLAQIPRDEIVIATKVGFDITADQVRHDCSRDGVLRSLEGSLKRLNVDRVDIVHIHDADHDARQALDETFPALADLRAQGVIKAIGAGMNQWEVPLMFAQHADFDCFMIAGRYTLLEQGALPLLDLCERKGISIIAAGIYNSGILATGSADSNTRYNYAAVAPEIIARVQMIETICRDFDVPLHTAATQFPLGHPGVKALVVGFQKISEVKACLHALGQPIPLAFWKALREKSLLSAPVPSSIKVNS